ncbi:MAG: hypothetical protein RQ833_08445 [Sphingomonadaceae bacterium]|nr:hypothetical protein [Sphingomonadaceae bacterium]
MAGILEPIGGLREAIPNGDPRVQTDLVDGDRVADRRVMRGTHAGAPLSGIPARAAALAPAMHGHQPLAR